MLDENLPTFLFRPMPDTPSSAVVYFTRSGSDPTPEYVLRLADAVSQPACRGRYAAALTDPYHSSDVVYAEAVVSPQWQQPTLSAAEIRELRGSGSGGSGDPAVPPVPKVPDTFAVQLYNPDQSVTFRWTPGSWKTVDAWEFAVPTQSFRQPSASRLDRAGAGVGASAGSTGAAAAAAAADSSTAAAMIPRTAFRWKRDGRLGNKDMTCYLVGKTSMSLSSSSSSSHHRGSREPDITVALFKHGRDPALTLYEPNMHRVDVQDRKGLELLLLLGAEVIRDLYLVPRPDPFNMEGAAQDGAAAAVVASGRHKNSRGAPLRAVSPPDDAPTMTSALSAGPGGPAGPAGPATVSLNNARPSVASTTPSAAAIEAETKRLQAMLEREDHERARRVQEEQARIRRMLEAEEQQQRQHDAEIAKETERLRQMYGVEGQDLPSHGSARPPLPSASSSASSPHLPPRPVSAGPRPERTGNNGVGNFLASLSNHRNRLSVQPNDERNRMQKKRSVYF